LSGAPCHAPGFSRAHQVADVLDEHQIEALVPQGRQGVPDHSGVEAALPGEKRVGVDLDDRDAEGREAIGVEPALPVTLDHADAETARAARSTVAPAEDAAVEETGPLDGLEELEQADLA
jgi:hypothetical protein